MKKFVAGMGLLLLVLSVGPLSAQDQSQDQNDQPDPYGTYDSQGPQGPSYNSPAPPAADQGQSPDAQSGQATPSSGMARLSFVRGDVSQQRGDNAQWEAVTVNTPIAVGDRVSTGSGARAEIELDYANIIRLSDGTTAKVSNLTRENIQVEVGQGLTTYSVLKGGEASAEIDTPNAAIHPTGPGEYRISVMPDGSTELIVRDGSAEVSEPQGSTQVERGQMITIQGTDNPEYKISSAPAADAWDSWNQDRDHGIMNAGSWRHTDRYYTGTQDLDPYGTWDEIPDYGQVWVPQQGPDWAPYSDGRWVWEPGWGWTWVSYEPWGWAPYHYGRWFVWGGNWVWWPGPVAAYPGYYPVWAPAYVSFFGWGGVGFGVGFGFGWGFGHVGWLPCGPGDWFHPWWGGWGAHFNTFHNTTTVNNYHNGFAPLGPRGEHSFSNVHEALNNARVRNGFSSMDSGRFGRDAVSGVHDHISAEQFRQASMVSGKMPINPSRESFSGAGRAASPSAYRSAPSASQHFFTSKARGGFNNQGARSAGSLNNSGRGQSTFNGNRSNSSFSRSPSQSVGARGNANTSGSAQSSRPGWHTFTPPSGANRSSQGYNANEHSSPYNSSRSTFGSNGRQPQSENYNRGYSQPNGYRPPASASRSGSSNSYRPYSRPPLNMRQPVVTPRGGYGGSSNSRGGNQPHGYSVPHGGGNSGGGNHGGGGGHSSGGHGGKK